MKTFGLLLLTSVIACGAPIITLTPEDEEAAALRKQIEDALDFTKGVSDICPVHRVKMSVKSARITYGLNVFDDFRLLIEKEFPFSREDISGGCVVDNNPLMPTTGKVHVCPSCVAAWNRWLDAAWKKVEAARSK